MARIVEYGPRLPRLEVTLHPEDTRLEVVSLKATVPEVRKAEPVLIPLQFLTQLVLPKMIHSIAVESMPDSCLWLFNDEHKFRGFESYPFLAQVYWNEHLSCSPRGAMMIFTGWSRTNANWHIRRISERYFLSGPDSGRFSGASLTLASRSGLSSLVSALDLDQENDGGPTSPARFEKRPNHERTCQHIPGSGFP